MRRQPSLRSQLNQIRLWVRQGRTDAWIAHKLDVSIDQLSRFKREQDLEPEGAAPARTASPASVPPPGAEDDDLSDLEAPAEEKAAPEEEPAEEAPVTADPPAWRKAWSTEPREDEAPAEEPADDEPEEVAAEQPDDDEDEAPDRETVPALDERSGPDAPDADDADAAPKRRRGRRGGRRRRSGRPGSFEATFDHGEEGYGLWLDPAVTDDPVYSEHWAGHRAVTVTLSAEAITIRRADTDGGSED